MSIEERLRDAVDAHARRLRPNPDAWSQIQDRLEDRPPRIKPRLAAAVLVGAVVVALVVLAVLDARGVGGPVIETPGTSTVSGLIVAETTNADLVVLSARTGRIVRTLVTDVGVGSDFSVSPDGSTLFFGEPAASVNGCPGRQVAAVPIAGGTPHVIAGAATQPAVSPDGHRLAYLSYLGPNGCTPPPKTLVVVPLPRRSAGSSQWTVPKRGQSLGQPSWAPDSRHLAYVLYDVNTSKNPRILNTQIPGASLAGAPYPQSHAIGWYGYLGDTGDFLGSYQPSPDEQHAPEVVALDPTTGAIGRRLVTLDGLTGVDGLTSDRTGRRVLVVATRAGTSPSQPQSVDLYQWNQGDHHATLVANSILAAAWIPKPKPTRSLQDSTPKRQPRMARIAVLRRLWSRLDSPDDVQRPVRGVLTIG